jgi:hypothetical protein
MKRRQIAVLVMLAVAGAAVAGSAVAGASALAPRAQLRNLVCQKALDPPARAVSITAVMRPLAGTQKLELRFDLLARAAGAGGFTPLSGTGLGTWITPGAPNPTLGRRAGDVWIVHHPVADLAAPAAYRFRVGFRWLGAHGKVLGTATKTTASCRQPELRPDLLVQSVTVGPAPHHPKLDQYVAVIRNAGATAAGPFNVEFSDGSQAKSGAIKRIPAHATRAIVFVGPACTATAPPSLTIDPQSQVDDFNRANNTASAVCP